jgi:flagellin-like protein
MTTRQRRAVSPVIATVILIAVAVALGIAVAFWASGLTSSFSKYEKLGVNTQYAIANPCTSSCPSGSSWVVVLGGQNTGSSDATITQIQINGVPYPISTSNAQTSALTTNGFQSGNNDFYWWNSSSSVSLSSTGQKTSSLSVPSGASFMITFALDQSSVNSKTFSSGQTIQVTIITAAGNNYPASIVLP